MRLSRPFFGQSYDEKAPQKEHESVKNMTRPSWSSRMPGHPNGCGHRMGAWWDYFAPFGTPNPLCGSYEGIYKYIEAESAMHIVWMEFPVYIYL